jgi:hypothetical protein
MRQAVFVAALAATSLVPAASFASDKPKPAPEKREEPAPDEMPVERTALAVAAVPVLPIGNFGDAFAFGIGATIGVDYAVHPHVQVLGRTGYVHHLPKAGIDASLGALPIWAGARYTFGVGDGAYLEGTTGPTVLFGRLGNVSDSEVKLGAALGGGYRIARLDVGARFVFWDVGHASDSMGLMATAGFTFASF